MNNEKSFEDQSYGKMVETNNKVDDFRKRVHAILKKAGWERKVGLQSALYHWEWKKGKQSIRIDGWHGTGKPGTCRHFGNAKSFFSLYHTESPGFKTVHKIDYEHSDVHLDALLARHDEKMAEAIRYVQTVA